MHCRASFPWDSSGTSRKSTRGRGKPRDQRGRPRLPQVKRSRARVRLSQDPEGLCLMPGCHPTPPLFSVWRSMCSQSEIWVWSLNAGMRGQQTEYAEVRPTPELQSWLSGSLCMSNRAWQDSPSRDVASRPQHGTYCSAHKICGREGEGEEGRRERETGRERVLASVRSQLLP